MPFVLIADNDHAVSSLLGEVLTRTGLQVKHAYDGEQAQMMARQPEVQVLVCDLDMPRASGLEVLESLQDMPVAPPTIVVSGYLDAAIEARLRRFPFVQALLRKPFDLLAFSRYVAEMASSRGDAEMASEAVPEARGGDGGGAGAGAAF